jgi:hypothetical protein
VTFACPTDADDYVLCTLELPGICNDTELDEQSELVSANPLADDFVSLELEDIHHPLLDAAPSRWTSRVTASICPAEGHPQDDGVVAHDELVDVQVQVRKRIVIATNRLYPSGWA